MKVHKARVIISGRVQGVGFRQYIRTVAHELGLTGWVKNNSLGTVEAFIEGSSEGIELFLHACKKGPSFAKVERVSETIFQGEAEFNNFSVLYS